MSNEKKEYATKKELAEMYQEMKNLVGEITSSQTKATPSPEGGSGKMPVLKCDKSGCTFSTDNEAAMMRHVVREELENLKPAEPEAKEPKPPEPKRHKTVDEFLDCPECFPRFEEAFKKRGYIKSCPNCGYPESKREEV